MTISVIITVYNLEKYIDQALQSVFTQVRPPDEVIVVDDASKDCSREICYKYIDKIKLISLHENSGVLNATLTGIKSSTGDVIAFLDGDDVWHPEKLSQVEKMYLEFNDVILISHGYEYIDGEGKEINRTDETQKNIKRIIADNPDRLTLSSRIKNSILGYKGIWLGSAYSFRRRAFDLSRFEIFINGFTVENFRRFCYQDHIIAQFIILNNYESTIGLINKPLFSYRVFGFNSSGVSNTLSSALSTIKKGYINALATYTLVSTNPGLKEENRRQYYHKLNYEYLTDLYSGKRFSAIKKFVRLQLHHWKSSIRFHEMLRLVGVVILGSENFLKYKSQNKWKN